MKFDLTPEQYDFIQDRVVKPLAKKNAKVYCFGSRARGDNQKFSDLDLMVESSPTDISDLLAAIREELQNSRFPFKVDLVVESDFSASYRETYERDKILF